MNVHELATEHIMTFQVYKNSAKRKTLTNNHELNNETNQVHNKWSQFMK